jgi:hypothetical protein
VEIEKDLALQTLSKTNGEMWKGKSFRSLAEGIIGNGLGERERVREARGQIFLTNNILPDAEEGVSRERLPLQSDLIIPVTDFCQSCQRQKQRAWLPIAGIISGLRNLFCRKRGSGIVFRHCRGGENPFFLLGQKGFRKETRAEACP